MLDSFYTETWVVLIQFDLHPWKLRWQWRKSTMNEDVGIFHCYVSLPEGFYNFPMGDSITSSFFLFCHGEDRICFLFQPGRGSVSDTCSTEKIWLDPQTRSNDRLKDVFWWCIMERIIVSLGLFLSYPPKMAFWRWFSFSQGGIC